MLKAVLFGSIGTLLETSHLQRDAFNTAFKEADLDWNWSESDYRAMLTSSGGERRIAAYAEDRGETVDARAIHARKTVLFQDKLAEGVELRPGVVELIRHVRSEGMKLGLVTTTSLENVKSVLAATNGALSHKNFDFVGTDDLVANNKPAPDIYELALKELAIGPQAAIAIEDTPISSKSPLAAGIKTIGFRGAYATGKFDEGVDVVLALTPDVLG